MSAYRCVTAFFTMCLPRVSTGTKLHVGRWWKSCCACWARLNPLITVVSVWFSTNLRKRCIKTAGLAGMKGASPQVGSCLMWAYWDNMKLSKQQNGWKEMLSWSDSRRVCVFLWVLGSHAYDVCAFVRQSDWSALAAVVGVSLYISQSHILVFFPHPFLAKCLACVCKTSLYFGPS